MIGPLLFGLFVLSLVMIPLEIVWPGLPGQQRFRCGWLLDLLYWFFTALIIKPVAKVAVVAALFPLLFITGASTFESLVHGHGPLGRQSWFAQAIQMIVLIDFIGYWMHRAFHSRRLWPFHAIHHSSVDLDWLSAARVHPVNDIFTRIAQAVIVVALGYAPTVLAGALPFFTAYAIFQHANVRWDFGPLGALLASPRFHRWHHTSADAGRDRNFAGLLPIWDMLFGTYYSSVKQPTRFGVTDAVPADLIGQFLWPFRRGRAIAAEPPPL
ncbi:MAG TPA: sterol desaturase family protein [Terriglobales bacterium]|nr:sterol desaturase family protein [Terriglobales bacterium]